ncbi:MAG: antitoxin YezG family protein [Lachnospiraceae bacterium]|jgi:hypothetical protein
MNEKLFQDIFDKVQDYLPADWEKMVFFAGYTDGSYSMKFYSRNNGAEYIDCFCLQGITKKMLIRLFMDIDKILAEERMSLDEKNRWTVFTMQVDSDGNMRTEFDYIDHTEDMVSYEREWKERYLL